MRWRTLFAANQRLLRWSLIYLLFVTSIVLYAWSGEYSKTTTYKQGTKWRPNPTWKGGLNTVYTLGKDFQFQNISFPNQALQMMRDDVGYWINITSGSGCEITVNRWFESSSPEVELNFTNQGLMHVAKLYVGSKGRPNSVTGVSYWTFNDPYLTFFVPAPDNVQVSWLEEEEPEYQYVFRGLFNETTGLRIYNKNVTVTAYFIGAANVSESFELNGTYTYEPTFKPLYFHFELGTKDRQYWLSDTEYMVSIYVFNDTDLTTYDFTFLDLAGAFDTYPYVEAKHYINGTLRTVEKRKVDAENKLQMNLLQGRKYTLEIKDGSSFVFGELLMTSDTSVSLTIRGIEFPQDVLLTYKYTRIHGERAFGTPTGNITITYQDLTNKTSLVRIYIKYVNGSTAYYNFFIGYDSFVLTWSNAVNSTDYYVEATIVHQTYGSLSWKQFFAGELGLEAWNLSFLGSLGFDASQILPVLLILFAFGCFSVVNAYVGAFFGTVTAGILTAIGWANISAASLTVAFALVILMGLLYKKKRVTLY